MPVETYQQDRTRTDQTVRGQTVQAEQASPTDRTQTGQTGRIPADQAGRTPAGGTPADGAPRPAGPRSPEARAAAALAEREVDASHGARSGTAVASGRQEATGTGAPAPAALVPAREVATDGSSSATPAGPSSAPPSASPAVSPAASTAEGVGEAPPARRRRARPARPDATLLPLPQVLRDVVLCLARLVVGVVLVAHGLQKLAQGAPGTAEGFAQMGVPQPEIAAIIAMVAELGGGVLLILGLMTPLAALLPAVVLVGAVVVHAGNGLFVTEGGWELAATLGAACLVLGAIGPGRLSVDALLTRLRRDR